MITRRCTQRHFLMRPDQETNNAFIYCLALAAQRCRIQVLFTVAMSNHHHTGIYDPEGQYPAFIEHFHKLFAKCQNALRGRWENFWSSEQSSVVRLVDAHDVLDKMTYALTNPVKDRLVDKAHHWPGVTSLDALLHGRDLVASRPGHFFREDGAMPDNATLSFVRPNGFEDLSIAAFTALVIERIQAVEERTAAERHRTGIPVLGRRAILAQDWNEGPDSRERRRQLNPRVAAASKWARVEAFLRNRAFRDAYAAARASLAAGVRNIVFPAGTYWLKRFTNAFCVPSSELAGT
jgi:putative transposase